MLSFCERVKAKRVFSVILIGIEGNDILLHLKGVKVLISLTITFSRR
jgi:hypothetical protein